MFLVGFGRIGRLVAGMAAAFGMRVLALMKPSAVLVNTARGGLIDEDALADSLDAGRIAGAGLGVFEAEPAAADGRLLRSSRTVLSPHIAGLTEECAARMGEMAARCVLDSPLIEGERRGLLLLGLSVLNLSPCRGLAPLHVPSTPNPSGSTAAS